MITRHQQEAEAGEVLSILACLLALSQVKTELPLLGVGVACEFIRWVLRVSNAGASDTGASNAGASNARATSATLTSCRYALRLGTIALICYPGYVFTFVVFPQGYPVVSKVIAGITLAAILSVLIRSIITPSTTRWYTTVQFWSDSMVILVSVLLIAGAGKQTGLVTGPWLVALLSTTMISHLLAVVVQHPKYVNEGIHNFFRDTDIKAFSKYFYYGYGIIVLNLFIGSPTSDIISQLVALLAGNPDSIEGDD